MTLCSQGYNVTVEPGGDSRRLDEGLGYGVLERAMSKDVRRISDV